MLSHFQAQQARASTPPAAKAQLQTQHSAPTRPETQRKHSHARVCKHTPFARIGRAQTQEIARHWSATIHFFEGAHLSPGALKAGAHLPAQNARARFCKNNTRKHMSICEHKSFMCHCTHNTHLRARLLALKSHASDARIWQDVSHARVFKYKHAHENASTTEARTCVDQHYFLTRGWTHNTHVRTLRARHNTFVRTRFQETLMCARARISKHMHTSTNKTQACTFASQHV